MTSYQIVGRFTYREGMMKHTGTAWETGLSGGSKMITIALDILHREM